MSLKFIHNHKKAFTLIELLVVIAIISLLMGILVPALSKVKKSARSLISKSNKKQIVLGVLTYSADKNGRFPESVAKQGQSAIWNWRQPTVLAGFKNQTPATHRSVSEYLRSYVESSSTMFCPSSPSKYPFAKEAWDAGDKWDNPDSNTAAEDPLFGTYCLYWNYVGYLEETGSRFVGPRSINQRRNESKLLISDYFGYGHWRNELEYNSRLAFGSCETLPKKSVTPGTSVSCDFWSLFDPSGDIPKDSIDIKLSAGFIDGHVETYTPADTTAMKISIKPDGSKPYPDAISPGGTFYIPTENR